MKTKSDFYEKIEDLESQGDYKEAFKTSLKYSQSTNKALAEAATSYLSTFDSYKYLFINKQIEYSAKVINLDNNMISKSGAINNLAICYRFKGDWQAYKYFLEKTLEYGGIDCALDLARLYSISNKEKNKVKKLLKLVIVDKSALEISQEDAKILLEDINNNRDKDYKYLLAKASYNKKNLSTKMPVIMTEEIEDNLLEAITNYELSDYKKSFTQLKKLANTYRITSAMIYLGDSYLYGRGTIVDYDKAALYYHEAEQSNMVDAILKLANFYKHAGHILLYKYYLEKARLKGCHKATLLLAKLYMITSKEKTYVKDLLKEILANDMATMDIIYEAELLYSKI